MSMPLSVALLLGLSFAHSAFAQEASSFPGPAKVEIRQIDGRWRLLVNRQPFYVKGAGLEFGDMEKLAAAGGNSFRTWRTDNGKETGRQVLDRAWKHHLYVTMGLDVSRERLGFDYSDRDAVARQLADIRRQVMELKDHPALLIWDIGNELNLNSHNPGVWDAVNDISKMIHRVDPNHPTTTSLAGVRPELVAEIKKRAPDLDFLSFQSYADIINLPRELAASGWDGPYMVTEWGATGHWECGKTSWGAPIEDNSSVKANWYLKRYEAAIACDTKNCMGSYVFLWGQKQERTPTWYGMFLASGASTETVDAMQYLWTGVWPEDRSPKLEGFWLDGKTARENVHLTGGDRYPARVLAETDGDKPLKYSWEVMEESGATTIGGDVEAPPRRLPGLVVDGAGADALLQAPIGSGAYRLFVYVFDKEGKAAYANIPFYVDAKRGRMAAGP